MAIKHLLTERIDLNLPHALHAGTLQAEIESSDSRKQAPERHRPTASRAISSCDTTPAPLLADIAAARDSATAVKPARSRAIHHEPAAGTVTVSGR
jgi:hypothetical protein